MIATIVDTQALWETMVAGFVAGVGTMIIFSLAILGATKFAEANRDGKAPEAAVFAVLAVLGLAATAGAVVVALIVMTSK